MSEQQFDFKSAYNNLYRQVTDVIARAELEGGQADALFLISLLDDALQDSFALLTPQDR
ncbi:hypothetical protein [Agathobaculum sp.]|uniref:hypothetical protein n=1 Tax=Agathobaculum sp. TaxID=2048138 RepID=UPI002A81E594|nr:hypothetical protein [Agathobaculum sp.]MDY3618263.1 hypothetical protein [Agathobaculum sp.]